LICPLRDVTEQKHIEAALRHREYEYRTLAENLPDNIQRIARDGTYLFINAVFANTLGVSVEDVIGKTNEELGIDAESEAQFVAVRETVFTTKQALDYDFSFLTDGGLRHYHSHLVPEIDLMGRVRAILAVTRDVTDRQNAKQQEFELALERERGRLLMSFMRDAAHEFRTPLAAINSSAYLLMRATEPERQTVKLRQIETYINRITTLLDMLMLMVRLQTVRELPKSAIDLGTLLEHTLNGLEANVQSSHPFQVHIPAKLPMAMGDSDLLEQALHAVIDNACRFSPENNPIHISMGTSDEMIWVDVEDHGTGICPETLPHMFKTFWRKDTAHSTPGLGLGLPITKLILQQHNGSINVLQTSEQGTTFRIELPIAP